jgi:tetratricopeptide (TPR) repeat protein
MLATIRDYATDRLAGRPEVESLRRRHAETYLELVEQAAPQLLGPRGKQLLDRLAQDHDNVRLAVDWAVEQGEAEVALRLLSGLWRFWQIRGHLHEGWERAQRVLAMPNVAKQPPALRARALGAAGGVAYWREDGLAAHELYREALELARTAGDRRLLAEALTNFGYTPEPSPASSAGLYGSGRPFFEEAAGLYRELGDQDGLAGALWALAFAAVNSGDVDGAGPLIEEGLALARASGNRFAIGWSLFGLAWIGLREGRIGDAVRNLVESLRVFEETGDVSGITSAIVGLTAGAVGVAKEPMWRLRGAGQAFAARFGVGFTETGLGYMDVDSLDRPIDDTDAQRAWDAGAAMTVDEAVAYAYEVAAQMQAALPPCR